MLFGITQVLGLLGLRLANPEKQDNDLIFNKVHTNNKKNILLSHS